MSGNMNGSDLMAKKTWESLAVISSTWVLSICREIHFWNKEWRTSKG